jgi:hypothetical protein
MENVNMKTTKNEALLMLSNKLMDQRLKPMLDRMIEYKKNSEIKPIKYNPSLDELDYMEWKAKQNGKLKHLKGGD